MRGTAFSNSYYGNVELNGGGISTGNWIVNTSNINYPEFYFNSHWIFDEGTTISGPGYPMLSNGDSCMHLT